MAVTWSCRGGGDGGNMAASWQRRQRQHGHMVVVVAVTQLHGGGGSSDGGRVAVMWHDSGCVVVFMLPSCGMSAVCRIAVVWHGSGCVAVMWRDGGCMVVINYTTGAVGEGGQQEGCGGKRVEVVMLVVMMVTVVVCHSGASWLHCWGVVTAVVVVVVARWVVWAAAMYLCSCEVHGDVACVAERVAATWRMAM